VTVAVCRDGMLLTPHHSLITRQRERTYSTDHAHSTPALQARSQTRHARPAAFRAALPAPRHAGSSALSRRQCVVAAGLQQPSGRLDSDSPPPQRKPEAFNGVMSLLLVNFLLFAADHVLHLPFVSRTLYLHHAHPHWWQFVTSAFCHANWEHLSGNAFMLLVFGKAVEQEEGALGVWASYLFCGLGASVASYLLLPATSGGGLLGGGASVVSLGASGAVFGLFSISVLVKLSWDWRKLLESFILGSFVLDKVWNEVTVTAGGAMAGGGSGVNHIAHLAGALCGVLLIAALAKLFPSSASASDADKRDDKSR